MEELKKIIDKAVGLASALEEGLAAVAKGKADNEARALKLNEQDLALVNKSKALSKREEAIKPIEDIAEFEAKAKEIKKEADELLHKARKDKDDFNRQAKADRVEIEKLLKEARELKAKAENEMVKVHKEWEVLRKEQGEWKDNFFKEIKQKVS